MILPARCSTLGLLALAVWLGICAQGYSAEEGTGIVPTGDAAEFDASAIEFFEKKVRPILVARCYECHSSESAEPKGGLRLDSRASLIQGGDTGAALVPGNLKESLLVDAVDTNELYEMPPKGRLPDEEIKLLREWVEMGAPWPREAAAADEPGKPKTFDLAERAKHWSLQPVQKLEPPPVSDAQWPRTPVDNFILSKLEQAGIKPAATADKRTLLRRVTFDLIGLPPTPEEIDAFLADESPQAYEKVVERLLASPHYGERWARHWLDLVRFSETHGHEFDFDIPNAYRYRDYVIRAFNDDLPFNQFVVEHVAGDLLVEPRYHADGYNESILATGFYFLGEALHSPVDVRQDEADRIDNQIDVFSKAFLGLTVSCARCHDHKFDAITTKDYYALAGFLQSSRYQQAFIDHPSRNADQLASLGRIRDERNELVKAFCTDALQPRLAKSVETRSAEQLAAWLKKRATAAASSASRGQTLFKFDEGSFGSWTVTGKAFGASPAKPLDAAPLAAEPGAELRLVARSAAHSGLLSGKLQGAIRSPTFTIEQPKLFYRVYGSGGEVRLIVDGLQLIQNPIYGGLKFAPGDEAPRWHAQDVSKWIGHRAYIEVLDDGDGYVALEQVVAGSEIPPDEPNQLVSLVLGGLADTSNEAVAGAYNQLLADVLGRWKRGELRPDELEHAGELIADSLERLQADAEFAAARAQLAEKLTALHARRAEIEAKLHAPRRAAAIADGTPENERVFIRGNHRTLGDEVPRRFLEVIDARPVSSGSGRLELAQRITDPSNPLLARVLVNRLWKHHFGDGLVRTPDDFGVMGQPPTHPELLDFLAGELVGQNWSIKAMHRTMVLSSAYQMGSQADQAADAADPENKLVHRMNVRRLEAEAIRDSLLAVSGRLDRTMYGPSVMPHLTEFTIGRGRPKESGPLDGDGRRSIYQMVRRNFLSPMFQAFDYPTPATTIGRRSVSNVPAQALVMMNNPLVIQQAELWAKNVLSVPGRSPDQRIAAMYVAAFARPPRPDELAEALAFVSQQAQGQSEESLQAWADLAHVLFNFKEFMFLQ